MAAQVEIGRLAIKVYPDTSGFRQRAQAEAEAIERRIDPITVDMEVDEGQAPEEAKSIRERIKDALGKIPVGIDLNGKKALAEANATIKMLEETVHDLAIDLEVRGNAIRDLSTKLSEMEILAASNPVSVPVEPKLNKASWAAAIAKIKAQKITAIADLKVRAIKDPFTVLERSTGLRMLIDLHKEKFKAMANFDQLAMKVGTLTLGFEALGGAIVATSGNILSWSNDIAAISGVLLPLPGLLVGAGLGAWAFSNALQDAGKYLPKLKGQFTELQKSMSEQFWSQAQAPIQGMIDNLFPAFAAGMKKVSKEVGALSGAMASAFSKNLDNRLPGMMDNLAKSINIASDGVQDLAEGLSILVDFGMKQLPAVAEGFNDIAAKFANFMAVSEQNGNLQEWTNRAVENLKNLGGVIWNTGRILGGLGAAAQAAGASTLESLNDTLQRAADVVSSGPFQAALTSFLKDIYTFTNTVGSSIGRAVTLVATQLGPMFGKALANLGPTLAAAINALFDGLTSPESVKNFETMFEGIRRGINALTPAFEVLGQKLSIVGALIGTAFANLSIVLGSFIEEFGVILEKVNQPLQDLFNTLGTSVGGILDSIKPGIEGFATALSEILTNLQPVAESMGSWKQATGPLAEILGSLAKTLSNFLAPILDTIARNMPGLAKAWRDLFTAIKPLVDLLQPLGSILGTIASVIIGVLMSAIEGVINGISNVVEGVKNIFNGLITFFTGVFTGNLGQAMEGLKQIVVGVWQTILGAFQIWLNVSILGALRGGLLKLLTFWKSGWAAVKTAWEAVKNAVTSGARGFGTAIVGIFQTIGSGIKTAWTTMWGAVKTAASAAWGFLKSGVSGMKTAIVGKFTELLSRIRQFGSDMVSAFKSKVPEFIVAGGAIIEGLKDGIVGKAQEALNAVKDVANRAVEVVRNIWDVNSPSKVFRKIAEAIPEGIRDGVNRKSSIAMGAVTSLADQIADVPLSMGDVEAPNVGAFNRGVLNAAGVTPAVAGGMSIEQHFHGSNIDAADVARELRFTLKQVSSNSRYGGE